MRCDNCVYSIECDVLKEFNHTLERMSIKENLKKDISTLRENLYILIAWYCRLYIEE